jgi:threonine/homoserine/homoserine lactone efflux protein
VFGVIVLPGMDMAFVASSALTQGLRGGLVAMAGIVAAGMLHTIVGATGVAALLVLWPTAFNALLVLGAAYMVWVGASILRSTRTAAPSGSIEAPPRQGAIFRSAVLTCLLNPKAYAFMLAVFPAFIRSTAYSVPVQAVRLGTVIAVTQLLVYGAVAAFVASAKRWTGITPNGQRRAARIVGTALIAGAVLTLTFAWRTARAQSEENLTTTTSAASPNPADFDFFVGRGRVAPWRLKDALPAARSGSSSQARPSC